ncbi:MAG TPA: MBOAT family O-acyltransferase [Myxococcota bacterium]|nr:MBOAT family O-acyltransferase [Myxococcota bacterium]
MLFNSLTYLVFLTIMAVGFWCLPHRARQPFLLIGSLAFYCSWRWQYGLLLIASIAINFQLGRLLHPSPSHAKRALAVALNLAILGYYKYLGFFAETLNSIAYAFTGERPVPVLHLVLPLGISFYTFQLMSYVIDIARGDRLPERRFLSFALYPLFWPHLIAGPIVRSHELIPQFQRPQRFSYERFSEGLAYIVYGLFLKVVLADNIAPFVDEGFSTATYLRNSALDNWTLAFAFGFQIYFDFAGYSSIAIGSARLIGIWFPDNFNFPYVASSPREFWRRWHITLSSWIRDYLYIPLQGVMPGPSHSTGGLSVQEGDERGRLDARRRNLALLVTWMLMGLWHGAAWTFVLWGLWHALLLLLYRAWSGLARRTTSLRRMQERSALGQLAGVLITLAAVMASWILFRASSVEQAFTMLATLAKPKAYLSITYKENFYLVTFLYTVGFFATFALREALARDPLARAWNRVGWIAHSLVYTLLVVLVASYLRGQQQFIYFQF